MVAKAVVQIHALIIKPILALGWLLMLFFASNASFAQIQMPRYDWVYTAGLDSNCNVNAITVDPDDNGYVVSFFQGTIDADPGPGTLNFTAANGGSALLQKISAYGNLIWAKQYGGLGKTGTNAIALDGQRNVYISGAYEGITDFDPGLAVQNRSPAGAWDAYVLKLDTAGNFLWVATAGAPAGDEWAFALEVDAAGNAVATGILNGPTDFDPGPGTAVLTPSGLQSAFVWKLNANGSLGWIRQIDGSGSAAGRGIDLDAAGNVWACGFFEGTMDFDPGSAVLQQTSAGLQDGYLVKLDAGGNLLWAQYYGGNSSDRVENVEVGPLGNVFLAGNFQDTVDFDPSPGSSFPLASPLYESAFLAQIDVNGAFRWAVNIPQSNVADGKILAVDSMGGAYVTGTYWGAIDFDPSSNGFFNSVTAGTPDAYVLKINANGGFEWAGTIDGSANENPHAIALDPNAAIWIGGNFAAVTDFQPGPGVHSLGPNDGRLFLVQWSQCAPPVISIVDTPCVNYSNHGYNFYQTGHYLVRIPGLPGLCDSLLNLNLTFNYDVTHIYQTFCTPDTINGQIYNHPGTFVQVMQNIHQCDSVLYYHYTGNPYYRYLVPVIACDQFTHRNVNHASSGTYYYSLPGPFSSCDTVEVLLLTIHRNSHTTLNVSSCGAIVINDSTYSSTGAYTQTLTNAEGCDSIVHLNFTLLPATSQLLIDTACNSLSLNGQTYTASGTYSQQLTNANGCDSTLTLSLTLRSSTLDLYQNACDSFTLNGTTYFGSGHYLQQLTNVQGCDSTIQLHLTVNQPSSSAMTVSTCQSYSLNSQVYLSSGTYTQVLANAAGCDSILSLFLTLWPNTSAYVIDSACDSFSLNGFTYYASGVFTQSMVNAQGCDSILNIYLTIDSLNPAIAQNGNSLSAVQSGGTYQWFRCDNGFVPIQGATGQSILAPSNGFYAVVVSFDGCQDTSECVQVTGVFQELQHENGQMQAYPNPTDGPIWISATNDLGPGELQAYDAYGRMILAQDWDGATLQQLNFDKFSAGVYHLRLDRAGFPLQVLRIVKW
ncbi:MAG: T9SS type A sorting domain-containing protein [Bacteroidetes bacterium]|nr:T9SS type A sorting domain-containing protein [Bacteroidota bacterium]